MKILPDWVFIVLVLFIIILLGWGATKSLVGNGSIPFEQAVRNCIPGGLLLVGFIILKVFLEYDLASFLSLFLIVTSLIFFYSGMTENEKNKQTALLSFASSIFGLGSGIPIGKAMNKHKLKTADIDNKNHN
jgi:hypothetical protein